MKTFFTLLVLIGGFFIFLFSPDAKAPSKQMPSVTQTSSLEEIEKEENSDTQEEIQAYTALSNEAPTAIHESQTFDTIKNILVNASNKSYKPTITLNTRINTFLYTNASREAFKQGLASAFNMSYDEVSKVYEKNELVWDWVNQFKE